MTSSASVARGSSAAFPTGKIVIIEAPAGRGRRLWMEEQLRGSEARTFVVAGGFDQGGPWAGVSEFFSALVPEIRAARPDLIERHAYELALAAPHLRRSVTVPHRSLTDLAPEHGKLRNNPNDRAYRLVHGLIDLLDSWKSSTEPERPWTIACDGYDAAGILSARFFKELMRRRGERLRLSLLIAAAPGRGEDLRTSIFAGLPAEVRTVDVARDPEPKIEPAEAEQLATELEAKIGDDKLEKQMNLPDLIRLWGEAGRMDKVVACRLFGLTYCNALGFYDASVRYGKDLIDLARKHIPQDPILPCRILLKLLVSYPALNRVEEAMRLAEEAAPAIFEHAPAIWRCQLLYMTGMFYGRFREPRDFAKAEKYLNQGLKEIQDSDMAEEERIFQAVFNRNGVAMIRSFQKRYEEALELCQNGIKELNAHVAPDKQGLHPSVLAYNIAQVYAAMGAVDRAIEQYAAVIAMDPNYSEYYNDRGNIFLRLERLEEARADYLKAIELSPPYFEVFTNLGQCYRLMGAMKEAIEAYSRALDIEPEQTLAWLGRAQAHEALGDSTEAIADYSSALARDGNLWEVFASRGVLRYEAGEPAAALADFDRAIELNANEPALHQNRATVYLDLARPNDAARDLDAALRLDPEDEDRTAIQMRLEELRKAS